MVTRRLAAAAAVVVIAGVAAGLGPARSAVAASASPPHVLVVVEENSSSSGIVGNPQLPYINSLIAQGGSASAWSDLSHPSLPNYLGLISGSIQNDPQDTTPADATYAGPTLVDELANAGIGWKAYMEDMPSACDLSDTFSPGNYDVNHDPFVYFSSIRNSSSQCNRVVPYTQLASDLSANSAPPFLWVTPNLQDDMHNGTPQQADSWLQSLMQTVTASQWWKQGGQLVLTWDEGESTEQIATVVVGPGAHAGSRLTTAGNHYGTLRGLEEAYGVGLLGGSAVSANGDLSPLLSSASSASPSSPAATPAPSSGPASSTASGASSTPFVKGITLFGASDYPVMTAAGFNAATGTQFDVPGGLGGMSDFVWLGDYDNSTCSWAFSDGQVASIVSGLRGQGQAVAYQMGDEPDATACPSAPAQYAARTALVHQNDPSAKTFVINDFYNDPSQTPSTPTPFKGTVDILAFDVYPCFVGQSTCDFGMIDRAVAAIHATGITDFWPVIQDFSGAVSWRWPTPSEITQQFDHWAYSGMSGYMVFAWDYLGNNVETQLGNVAALAYNNARFSGGVLANMPFSSLDAVDSHGNLHPGSSTQLSSALWPGANVVRGVTLAAGGGGGYTLDLYGGLHPFGTEVLASGYPYWPGFDIARGVALATATGQRGGYVLDGWGGVHAFNGAPAAIGYAYWPGFDIARAIALCPNGPGGYVLDGWGGIHPFNGAPVLGGGPYWPGWDIARGLTLTPDCRGGYVLDGWGGIHPFGDAAPVAPSGYWPGWDIARGIALVPGSASEGYVVDGWGGFHPFGGAPVVFTPDYMPGQDVVRGLAAA